MPGNYLSLRYSESIHQSNDHWDTLFGELFGWSPFGSSGAASNITRSTRSGNIFFVEPISPIPSEADDDEMAADPVLLEFHNEWIEMEYATVPSAQEKETFRHQEPTDGVSADQENMMMDTEPEKPYRCEKCYKHFRLPQHLRIHWTTHSKERPHKCECGKSYKSGQTLMAHRRRYGHHNWTVSCDKCGKPFAKESHMVLHNEMACQKYLAQQ